MNGEFLCGNVKLMTQHENCFIMLINKKRRNVDIWRVFQDYECVRDNGVDNVNQHTHLFGLNQDKL